MNVNSPSRFAGRVDAGACRDKSTLASPSRTKPRPAFHELTVWSPGFIRSGPPEGGTPNKLRARVRFVVPIHARKRKKAFHEPHQFRVRAPVESGGGPQHSKTLTRWPQSRAFPPVVECASLLALWQWRRAESARGLAQSKTLPRDPQVHGPDACAEAKAGFP
jgi:hypothetical protein